MTTPVLAPAASQPVPDVQPIPAADLLIGYVIDHPEGDFRVANLLDARGPLGADLTPSHRVAIAVDSQRRITLGAGDTVRVRVPADVYTVEMYATRCPYAPAETVRIAAETEGMALIVARRLIWQKGRQWANIVRADGRDLAVVTAVA